MNNAMNDVMELSIISHDKIVFKGGVKSVNIPTAQGYIGVLPGHIPLTSLLAKGDLSYFVSDSTTQQSMQINSGGFCFIQGDKLILLVD